ncbi:hypothetical protein ABT288_42580, partial [Streptomyces sp. NPDC001093]
MRPDLPSVAPSVTAGLVAALSPRLRKRLDAGIAKLADRPTVRDGDTVRIAVDDDTDLELHAPAGTVTSADGIRCGCLLAPDCLHRAAAASSAPIADDTDSEVRERDSAPATQEAVACPESAPATHGPRGTDTAGVATTDLATQTAGPAPEQGESESADAAQRSAALALRAAAAAVLEAGADGAGAVPQAELLRAAHTARL